MELELFHILKGLTGKYAIYNGITVEMLMTKAPVDFLDMVKNNVIQLSFNAKHHSDLMKVRRGGMSNNKGYKGGYSPHYSK